MKNRGIAKKWIFNNLLPIVVLLSAAFVVCMFAVKNYYYGEVKSYLSEKVNTVYRQILDFTEAENMNFANSVKNIVENYKDKEKIELICLDNNGTPIITSSGFPFSSSDQFPDYVEAKSSYTSRGTFLGKGRYSKQILAMTVALPVENSEVDALRFVVSLDGVDRQIFTILAFMLVICLVIMAFVVISGVYFIRSIVHPIRELRDGAKEISEGNFKINIRKKSDDEIGELCDAVNNMAKELEHTENMKNDFMSSVSHELRTPLTAIQGWTETLSTIKNTSSAEYKQGMNIIVNETQRLSVMVEELLDFSRINCGRFNMNFERIDLVAEVTDAVLMFEKRAQMEEKILEYDEPTDLIIVNGDRHRLRQVFVNIIDNALKYSTAESTVTVKIKTEDDNVVVKIIDNGKGISAKDIPYIKQKFYQADHTVKGSGIGLAVADEIMQQHGGTLDIQSEKDIGTVVTITVPTYKEEEKKEETQE